jgi:menaquinone-dependent protoporphyrinogen oxidase
MSDFLIIYSSTDGHTKTICKRVINFLKDENSAKLISLGEAKNLDLSKFNKIIIGASIRYGRHSKELYRFIELNKDILNQKQSIFFFS